MHILLLNVQINVNTLKLDFKIYDKQYMKLNQDLFNTMIDLKIKDNKV